MANEILVKYGTPIRWEAGGGEFAMTMASLGINAARQGAKGDLGATWAARHRVLVENNMDVAPDAGDVLEYWWMSSPSGTAGTTNTGAASGTDAAYTGSAGGSIAETKVQLQYIGAMPLTPDADGVVQIKSFVFFPIDRWGAPIIINLANQILEGDDDAHRITLTPIIDEVQ